MRLRMYQIATDIKGSFREWGEKELTTRGHLKLNKDAKIMNNA